jgi:hypothetical protein
VIDAAMQAEGAIVETYLGPDRTVRELMDYARHQGETNFLVGVQRGVQKRLGCPRTGNPVTRGALTYCTL